MIDEESKRWNIHRLKELCVPGDVELILSKQPVKSKKDFYTWKYNRSGDLTVRSAYWLAREEKIREIHPEALALPSINPIKEKIWKIQTPPKIKNFLWKVLSEAVPVADLILKRGLKMDGRCQLCGLEGELIQHVLFQCDPARQVWALSGIPHPEWSFTAGSLYSNIYSLLNTKLIRRGENENKRAWPWVIWRIWKNRNDFIFSGNRWELEETQRKARLEADEWFLAQVVEDELGAKETNQVMVVEKRWSPPEHDWLMCNIGMDWVKKTNSLGVAWVVRNHRGVVLLHSRRAFSNIGSLEEARWTVVLWAMESMTSLHLEKVVFAGEFKEIFMAVQKPHLFPALSFQVGEINRLLAGMLEFRLHYVVRAENRGASIIAQSVTREGRLHSYVAQGPPRWLFELFVNESRFL